MALLAAVLHLGNVEFSKKSAYHNDETVMVRNASVVSVISLLLMVKEEDLLSALTCKRTKAAKGETIIINYKMADAIARGTRWPNACMARSSTGSCGRLTPLCWGNRT